MDTELLITQLKAAETYSELNIDNIKLLMQSDDELIRCDTIELLSDFVEEDEIQTVMFNAINDSNYLVRCEVYEAMGEIKNATVISLLIKRVRFEKNPYAKMYLVSAICNIAHSIDIDDELMQLLYDDFKSVKEKNVKIAYMCLMYLTKRDMKIIYNVLSYLHDEDYHIRFNVINLLIDVLDKDNIAIVLNTFKEHIEIENSPAVLDRLRTAIAEIEK